MRASDNLFPKITLNEAASDGSDFSNPSADYRVLFLGEDGELHLKDSSGTVTDVAGAGGDVATDAIWDAAGDLAVGTGANTAAKLTKGADGTLLGVTSGSVGYRQATAILLDYALASDISNQALSANTPYDVIANQNFTKVAANSLIEIIVRGGAFTNDATAGATVIQIVVNSGGTPITKNIGTSQNPGTVSYRGNPFGGGANVYISGLGAATHTVKVQVVADHNDHFYCRASTVPASEFANVQVIEHL